MWFEKLMGFEETEAEQLRNNIDVVGNRLVSRANKREYVFGELEIPSLEVLRTRASKVDGYSTSIKIAEQIENIQNIHQDRSNHQSVIQVASQFNLLEMMSPNRTPEDGVGIYEYDATQGPACAIACGAGTIYRNYFVQVDGQTGQTSSKQIDCLDLIAIEFNNDKHKHWEMRNGYALLTRSGLRSVNEKIEQMSKTEREYLEGKLKVGIQWDAEVTIGDSRNRITQLYCSALPISYLDIETELWAVFAQLILDACYEASFYIALENYERTGNNKVFLTLIGGGAFGNKEEWILKAIEKSIIMFAQTPLDVRIVSYGRSNTKVKALVDMYSSPRD